MTAKGRRVFQRLWKSSEWIRIQLLAGFSADEAQVLVKNLRRLIENMASVNGRRHHKRAKPMLASASETEN